MSAENNKPAMRIGEFLVENGIVSESQLNEALGIQKDNSDRLIGEILVTIGALSKEELIMSMEMFFMLTGYNPRINEWLDQEEIDMIKERMDSDPSQK